MNRQVFLGMLSIVCTLGLFTGNASAVLPAIPSFIIRDTVKFTPMLTVGGNFVNGVTLLPSQQSGQWMGSATALRIFNEGTFKTIPVGATYTLSTNQQLEVDFSSGHGNLSILLLAGGQVIDKATGNAIGRFENVKESTQTILKQSDFKFFKADEGYFQFLNGHKLKIRLRDIDFEVNAVHFKKSDFRREGELEFG